MVVIGYLRKDGLSFLDRARMVVSTGKGGLEELKVEDFLFYWNFFVCFYFNFEGFFYF